MKPGRYSGHFAAANDETSLFEGYVVFKTYDPSIVPGQLLFLWHRPCLRILLFQQPRRWVFAVFL